MIQIDEQIAYQREPWGSGEHESAILASLERLKAIDAVKMPELEYMQHRQCEDSWYSCPKSEDGCANDGEGDECNCGADDYNKQLDTLRDLLKRTEEKNA